MKKLEVVKLVVGELLTNCYLLKSGKEGVVVDPGAEGSLILKKIEELNIKVKYILDTHGHFDHIAANDVVREATGARLAIHHLDACCLTSAYKNSSLLLGWNIKQKSADILLNEGDVLEFGFCNLTVLHTPGHTKGSASFLIDNKIFVGDLLFAGSIGRTDLPGGSSEAMTESLKRLGELPEDTVVYPGHGEETTIKEEVESNPFLNEAWFYGK